MYYLAVVILAVLLVGVGVGIGNAAWDNDNNVSLAPTYALDNGRSYSLGGTFYVDIYAPTFSDFWQEATKHIQFTIDGKPVEITDMQIFYKAYTPAPCSLPPVYCPCPKVTYGNITYYPLGVDDSQTYVAPTPAPTPYYERDCLVFGQDCDTCIWRCTMYGWHKSDIPKIPMSYIECETCPDIEIELEWGNVTDGWGPTPTPSMGVIP